MNQRALTLSSRYAMLAALAFMCAGYQFLRSSAVIQNQHLTWVPQTTQPSLYRLSFHAAIGLLAAMLCIIWSIRAIASLRLRPTPAIPGATARQSVVSSKLARHLPPIPDGMFTVKLNSLGESRWWIGGAGLFLMTSLPYWLLWFAVGHIVAFGPIYLAVWLSRSLPLWLILALVMSLGLVAIRVMRRRRNHDSTADRPALAIISFMAGSESWSSRERWRVSVLYSLWVQQKGVFPLLAFFTTIPAQRLMLEIYARKVRAGEPSEEAMSHILTIRTARLITAALAGIAITVIRIWPRIWAAVI